MEEVIINTVMQMLLKKDEELEEMRKEVEENEALKGLKYVELP